MVNIYKVLSQFLIYIEACVEVRMAVYLLKPNTKCIMQQNNIRG